MNYANSVNLLRLTNKVLLSGEKKKLVLLSLAFNSNFRKETKCINTHSGVYSGTNRPSEQILTEILPAFHIRIIFIFIYSSFTGILRTHNMTSSAPSWLDSSIGRALDRHPRGHRFESRLSLNFFRLSFRNWLSCALTARIFPVFNRENFAHFTTLREKEFLARTVGILKENCG